NPAAARGRGLPSDDDDHRAAGGNAVRGDLTLRLLGADARRSDDEQRPRIDDGTVTGRLDPLPSCRSNEPDSVRCDHPVSGARERYECSDGEAHQSAPLPTISASFVSSKYELEIAARESGERGRSHDCNVCDRPDANGPSVHVTSAEGAELKQEA